MARVVCAQKEVACRWEHLRARQLHDEAVAGHLAHQAAHEGWTQAVLWVDLELVEGALRRALSALL